MKRFSAAISETQRKRSLNQRMTIIHGVLLVAVLVIVARLLELQVVRGEDFRGQAQSQHFGGVVLPAKRGEILSRNSKTGENNILATNTTLDMLYVDPLITDNPVIVAETLADALLTQRFHDACTQGSHECPRELEFIYGPAFDPIERVKKLESGAILEPLSSGIPFSISSQLPDITEARRQFARSIEERIQEKKVRYIPLLYGATKIQMKEVDALNIDGVSVSEDQYLVYADPEQVDQLHLSATARKLAKPLDLDEDSVQKLLRSRPLRYVPIMHKLPPELSLIVKDILQTSRDEALAKRSASAERNIIEELQDPLKSIALLPEHWRFYPDSTLASQVVGFLNPDQEAQYGVERTFNPLLRGQEGLINTVSDLQGRQIVTGEQTLVTPKDGDTVVLTIDRFIQKKLETLMDEAVRTYEADSGQAIVMDPETGRVLAMVSAPIFDSNNYGSVFEKEPLFLDEAKQHSIVVELYHPDTNEFIVKAYYDDVFLEGGRERISAEKLAQIQEIEQKYNLRDVVRYYLYIGENSRREIFPTTRPDVWLKFKNNIGVGAYLNRTIQEIYEPGSVLKPITMAIAMDQGEVTPDDIYDDNAPVQVDEFVIKNALKVHYGKVTMTNCLEFSINTCMTNVGTKLGKKLFHRMLERFGFGRITGIELEDELPGELIPWRKWSNAQLATSAFGQGISATPLQVVTAFASLANQGKLMRPTIVDRILHSDGTVEVTKPYVVDQVITPETAETITAMLVSTINNGYGKTAKIDGYKIAGKTGTSQIAGPGGRYESGTGSVITSFAGYAPIDNPRFVILVKINRPRNMAYGSQTAAPLFRDVAKFLFEYYGIPPDEN